MAKAAPWTKTDAQVRKRGEQTGLDTLVVHAVNDVDLEGMLMFPVSDLPELSKGKGNKIISIPSAEAAKGVDGLAHLFLLPPQSTLTIHVGKRKIKLRPEELQKVVGERGRRGSLMRGLQRIDRVEIDSPARSKADDSEE